MDLDQRFERWREWLEEIWSDVIPMLASRQIWRGYMHLARANPHSQRPPTFQTWITMNYVRTQAVGIRRQADRDSRVVSMARLISEVGEYPMALSRERYLRYNMRAADDDAFGSQYFDQLIGAANDYIEKSVPEAELEQLLHETAGVRKWVNKQVAHWESGKFEDGVSIQMIHDCLDLIVDLLDRYRLRILASGMARDVAMPPWEMVLTRPWQIPSDWNPMSPPPVV